MSSLIPTRYKKKLPKNFSYFYSAREISTLLSQLAAFPTVTWISPTELHIGIPSGRRPYGSEARSRCCNVSIGPTRVSGISMSIQCHPRPVRLLGLRSRPQLFRHSCGGLLPSVALAFQPTLTLKRRPFALKNTHHKAANRGYKFFQVQSFSRFPAVISSPTEWSSR